MRMPRISSLELAEVCRSPIHGLGVFARNDLPAGTVIGRYAGRRYTAEQIPQRDWNRRLTYVFGLSDGSVIDGAQGGNATRHLNHCCEPNCQAVEFEEGGRLAVWIETLRDIRHGEELFIDYALQIAEDDDPSEHLCHCGAPACRGTMVASPAA